MNGRERIIAAIDHREPDRVPLDLGATPSSGISAFAYSRLTDHLLIPTGPPRVYDVVQQLAQPDDIILDRFGVDVIDIGRAYNRSAESWHPFRLNDGTEVLFPSWFTPERQNDGSWVSRDSSGEVLARMPATGTFFDQQLFPYLDRYPDDYSRLPEAMEKVLWAAYAPSPWDHAGDREFWPDLRRRVETLRARTDRALLVGVGCNLFEWGTFVRRMDNFLMDLALDPVGVERFLDAIMERHLATLELVCRHVGDLVDIVKFGDDLGTDLGPFMAPDIYRRLFKPRHRILCDFAKRHSSMRTMLHSCGSIAELMGDLIEVGFEVINPVQTNARGMDPSILKREFGRDICFWGGGVDTRSELNRGTPAAVRTAVLRNLGIFSPGGGYVFNTVHNILPDVPPSNIVAMFDALDEFNGRS